MYQLPRESSEERATYECDLAEAYVLLQRSAAELPERLEQIAEAKRITRRDLELEITV